MAEQLNSSTNANPADRFDWRSVDDSDGVVAVVDNTSLRGVNESIHYSAHQYLGGFYRRVLDKNNHQLSISFPGMTDQSTGQRIDVGFHPEVVIDEADGKLLVGSEDGTKLYESSDGGDRWTQLNNSSNYMYEVHSYVYGYNNSDGTLNPNALYVGAREWGPNGHPHLYVRSSASGKFTQTSAPQMKPPVLAVPHRGRPVGLAPGLRDRRQLRQSIQPG